MSVQKEQSKKADTVSDKANVDTESTETVKTDDVASEEQTDVNGSSSESEETTETEKKPEEKIAELEASLKELNDQYLRKCADFDNYRKRMLREKQEAFDYANTNLLTDLIAILDDFDRALVAGTDAKDHKYSDYKPVVDGIKMINKQLRGLLEAKYNLTAYGEKGDVFNHDLHEAIGSSKGATSEPICAEVYLKGYKLKERVIRPAKVMVQMPEEKSTSDESTSKEK